MLIIEPTSILELWLYRRYKRGFVFFFKLLIRIRSKAFDSRKLPQHKHFIPGFPTYPYNAKHPHMDQTKGRIYWHRQLNGSSQFGGKTQKYCILCLHYSINPICHIWKTGRLGIILDEEYVIWRWNQLILEEQRRMKDTIYVNLSWTMVISHLPGQERMMGHQVFQSTLAAGVFFRSYMQLWVPSVSQPKKGCGMWGFSYGFVRLFHSFERLCQFSIFQTFSSCAVVVALVKWLLLSVLLGQTKWLKFIFLFFKQPSKQMATDEFIAVSEC